MSLRTRIRDERGQAILFTVVSLLVLLGGVALVVDVGSWFRAQRHLQTAADAAALSGAQDLPDEGTATNTALSYAQLNWSGVNAPTITFPDTSTIDVAASQSAPGLFARIYGAAFNQVTVNAHAEAKIGTPSGLNDVAPVVVNDTVACTFADPSCFGQTKQLNFSESNLSSSSFGLVDLSCPMPPNSSCGAPPGGSVLANWINCTPCYNGTLYVNSSLQAVTGQKVGPVSSALESAGDNHRLLLFPVFDTADNAAKTFHIVGWSAFQIDPGGVLKWKQQNPSCEPDCKVLQGHFVTYLASDLAAGGDSGGTNYGVRTVALTK